MQRMFYSKLILILNILYFSSSSSESQCEPKDGILECHITSSQSIINTGLYGSVGYNSITLIYDGNVNLSLTAPLTIPISIEYATNTSTLQISYINTNATIINIRVRLTSTQVLLPLFTADSNITAKRSTLSVIVSQEIADAKDFKLFDASSSSKPNFPNFQLSFDSHSTSYGTLYLPNIIRQLTNTSGITISGNSHYLTVNRSDLPVFDNVYRLSLKNLQLHDRILDKFTSLKEYSIEKCTYNKTAEFLQSSQSYNISLQMINNDPINNVLPGDYNAFKYLNKLIRLTLIEPKLNSLCLKAINQSVPSTSLLLELGSYEKSNFDTWSNNKPLLKELTINNIPDLNIFPSKVFNRLHALLILKLQGSFQLKKSDICIFFGINLKQSPETMTIILNTTSPSTNADICADTYIKSIIIRKLADITCPPNNTCEDCERWANQTKACKLTSFENTCSGTIEGDNNPFFYHNGSYLYEFFEKRLWLSEATTIGQPAASDSSFNIGAIVGSLCGLIVAILIFGTTVFCIYRYRRTHYSQNSSTKPEDKYKPSSLDTKRVSIATSKSSQSSRYALQKGFFPPIKPHDEIAPPLYTAPSESVGSMYNYRLPTAPSAPRESVSTHATHVYETLDN